MKIFFMSNGDNIHTQKWAQYFAKRGHEIHIISLLPVSNSFLPASNVHVLRRSRINLPIISHWLNLLSFIMQIKGLIKRNKPDILHASYIYYYGLLGALSGFHPLLLTAMGSDILIDPKRSLIVRMLIKHALKKADLIISDGDNTLEEIHKLGIHPAKLKFILPGVDTKKFNPEQRNTLRKKLRICNSPLVISTRNLHPVYDIETLIKAVPIILHDVPETKFIIIGKGSQREHLEALAFSLNALHSIIFLGEVPNNDLPGYLAIADVFVTTSLSDTISISLLEAMACGVSPVATNIGDINRWVHDGENGFIIPIKRPDILAQQVVFLIKNREIRQKIAALNLELIRQHADFETEMIKAEKLYEGIMRKEER